MRASLWLFSVLPVLKELGHRIIVQVFIEPFVVDLDHGSVDAGSEAFDFLKSEETVSARLVIFNAIEILDSFLCLFNVVKTTLFVVLFTASWYSRIVEASGLGGPFQLCLRSYSYISVD